MIYVIFGAPLSGKSTYVKATKKKDDVVFDYDEIARAIFLEDVKTHGWGYKELIIRIRDSMINDKKKIDIKYNLYIITTFLDDNLLSDIKYLPHKIIAINPGIEICKARNSELRRYNSDVDKIIDDWFVKYTDNTEFYKSKEWKEMRQSVLKRDGYECKICRVRKGIATEADEVHHLKLLSLSPEDRLYSGNLISVCGACHKQLHNHLNNELSALGKEMQEVFYIPRENLK